MNVFGQSPQTILKNILPARLYGPATRLFHIFEDFFLFRKAGRSLSTVLKIDSGMIAPAAIKPVVFFGGYRLTSFKLGGLYPVAALKQMGLRAASGRDRSIEKIKNTILVTIRRNHLGDLRLLKTKNNKIIVDVRDNYYDEDGVFNPDFFGRDAADYIIFPSQVLLDRFLTLGPTSSACEVLHGYADPAITCFFEKQGYRQFNRLHCCYFGFDFNLDVQRIKELGNNFSVTQIPLTENNFNQYVSRLKNYNMHIDLSPARDASLYKPLTKVLIAAECRSNIMIRKTPRVLELLPADYPFLIEDDDIASVMERAAAMVGTPEWQDALSVMDDIRKACAFRNHIKKLIRILEALS